MKPSSAAFPSTFQGRNRWVVSQRGERHTVDPRFPYAFLKELELTEAGTLAEVVTVFLTNRECPWKCYMCDLWRNTLETSVDPGVIPDQISHALRQLKIPESAGDRGALQIKLYNSGSYFDPKAIPPEDDDAIVKLVAGFGRVIVESHPRLIGERCRRFKSRLASPLEVAMGLETVHPAALDRLNKGFALEDFGRSCRRLAGEGIGIRVFLLVNCPFIDLIEQRDWVKRSVAAAVAAGAGVIALIPTRQDSGALRTSEHGRRAPTRLRQLEDALDDALRLGGARFFVDLWDLQQFSRCHHCFEARRTRLEEMNHQQTLRDRIECPECDGD